MKMEEYQRTQHDILYQDGKIHSSHDMFIDMGDMWRGCLACRKSGTEDLKEPCTNVQPN